MYIYIPRSPGTHIVGPWVIDSINVYKDLRTGTQYIGNWASRVYMYSISCWTEGLKGYELKCPGASESEVPLRAPLSVNPKPLKSKRNTPNTV